MYFSVGEIYDYIKTALMNNIADKSTIANSISIIDHFKDMTTL